MILADKIMLLRKKKDWSQEQLAEQLGISRQSVSKWESGASIPDLDKILKMSALFEVSTDYLLKDEIEELESTQKAVGEEREEQLCRSISLEEANAYMDLSRGIAKKFAFATMLCVFSVIPVLMLGGLWEYGKLPITEDAAGGIGTIIMLLFIIAGVAIFILEGMKLSKYEYLEKEEISLQYGVEGIVNRRKEAFAETFRRSIAIGTVLCILGLIPLMGAAAMSAGDLVYVFCVGILLFFVAVASYFFVYSGCIQGSFQKLLQEEDYSKERKSLRKRTGWFAGVYWCITTAIFLAISLPQNSWKTSWIIWPVAGVLYAALQILVNVIATRQKA